MRWLLLRNWDWNRNRNSANCAESSGFSVSLRFRITCSRHVLNVRSARSQHELSNLPGPSTTNGDQGTNTVPNDLTDRAG